jgi:hypothetical protein
MPPKPNTNVNTINASISKVTQDNKNKFKTFKDKYDNTKKLIEKIRLNTSIEKDKFNNLATVLINLYKNFDNKLGNNISSKFTKINDILNNYNYNKFIICIQDTCKKHSNDCESNFALQNISDVLKNKFIEDKQIIVKNQLATLFILDFVNMWLGIIEFIEKNPDKKVSYHGYETKFSKLFNEIVSDQTIFEYIKDENQDTPEIKKKYLKNMFLEYLLKGMEITNKCTNNLSDLFDANFKNNKSNIGEDIFCMKNYAIYFFIKEGTDPSMTQILKTIDNNNEKTIDELLKMNFDKKYEIYELKQTLGKIKSNNLPDTELYRFCDKVQKNINDSIIKKIIIAANKKNFIKEICDRTFQEQIKLFICGNVKDVSNIYSILKITDFEGKHKLIQDKKWNINENVDEKMFKIMGIENDLNDIISGGTPKEREEEANKIRLAEEAEEKILAEEKRLAAEEANKIRLAEEAEEAERKRLEAEEAERKRLEAEEAERKRLEAEEAERKRLEAEEAERKRLEAEEAERKRLEAEEAERKRLEAEEKRLAAEKLEKEAAERRIKEAAEAERKRKEEAERKRLQDSLFLSLNKSLKDSVAPIVNETVKVDPPKLEAIDDQLRNSLLSGLNMAFKDEPKVKVIDDQLRNSLLSGLNGSFKVEPKAEVLDNKLQRSLLPGLNGSFKVEPKAEVLDNKLQRSLLPGLNNLLNKKMPEKVDNLPIVEEKEEDFIKLIIKNPTTDADADTIIKMITKNNSQDPQEIDEIGNTHFHYIAGSFYEQKEAMFEAFKIDLDKIRSFYNYQNAEGTTPLMILFSKCENIDDLQKISIEFVDDIEQEDIYGNSIFSILTKKIVEFSRKEEIQIQNTSALAQALVAPLRGASSDFIEKIIQNKITSKDIPETNIPIDPLENTALHYVAGSFMSTENKMEIMKDQLANKNYQNIEGTTPLMILIKHMTKEDLEKEDVKDFIAENIADLEQEDIYGNSIFSILTKKIVEFSGEEKVEFQQ